MYQNVLKLNEINIIIIEYASIYTRIYSGECARTTLLFAHFHIINIET